MDEARAEAAQARQALERASKDLHDRTRERDAARGALAELRKERDQLSEQLLQVSAEAEEAAQSRTALEEIHQALSAARSRIGPR